MLQGDAVRALSSGMTRLPSLHAVRCFAVAARLESFTAAARELHVTQGAVSRMVQSLEEELGVQLFTRNGRFISLTPTGRAYCQEVSEALDQIRAASQRVRQTSAIEMLVVMASAGFATRWLVPRLQQFQRQHPTIQVALMSNEAQEPGMVTQGHLKVRYGTPPWPEMEATRLPIDATLAVVCSPQWRESNVLRGPEDLVGQPLLAYTGETRDLWREYFQHFGLAPPNLGQVPRFYQLLMLTQAAVSGLGLALVPLFLIEPELQSGRLVQAIDETFLPKRAYYVTHPKGADLDQKVRLFKEWLMAMSGDS